MRKAAVKVIPEKVVKDWTFHYDRIWCDRCGTEITDGEGFPPRAELWISVNEHEIPDDIDDHRWRRDYCPPCLTEIRTGLVAMFGDAGIGRGESLDPA